MYRGQVIGTSGHTGDFRPRFAHLHLSTSDGQYPINDDIDSRFDPYGWTTNASDPWPNHPGYNGAHSRRLLLPGAADSLLGCPTPCTESAADQRIADDSMPCSLGYSDCFEIVSSSASNPGVWQESLRIGLEHHQIPKRNAHYVVANGSITATAKARWIFNNVDTSAVYKIETYIPAEHANSAIGRFIATRAARYVIKGATQCGGQNEQVVVVDQLNDDIRFGTKRRWIGLGYYRFSSSTAEITLGDAAYLGNYTEPQRSGDVWSQFTCGDQYIYADAVRITKLCGLQCPPGSPGDPGLPTPTPTSGGPG